MAKSSGGYIGLTDTLNSGVLAGNRMIPAGRFGVHYFSVSASIPGPELGRLAEAWLGVVWDGKSRGSSYYRNAVMGSDGCWLRWDHVNNADSAALEIKGGRCELVTLAMLSGLLNDIAAMDTLPIVTRLDCAWDGWDITPGFVRGQWNRGRVRARTDLHKWIDSGTQTFYIGLGEDGKKYKPCVMCTYNRRGFNRMEARFGESTAAYLGSCLRSYSDAAFAREALSTLAHFVTVGGKAWGEFVDHPERVVIPVASGTLPDVESNSRYVERNARQFGAYAMLHGWDAVRVLCVRGASDMGLVRLASYGLSTGRVGAFVEAAAAHCGSGRLGA